MVCIKVVMELTERKSQVDYPRMRQSMLRLKKLKILTMLQHLTKGYMRVMIMV